MISESTLFHLTLICDAIPPTGIEKFRCHTNQEFVAAVTETGGIFVARQQVNAWAQLAGWRMDSSMPRKYPDGRHLCPTCAQRFPNIKWAKR